MQYFKLLIYKNNGAKIELSDRPQQTIFISEKTPDMGACCFLFVRKKRHVLFSFSFLSFPNTVISMRMLHELNLIKFD